MMRTILRLAQPAFFIVIILIIGRAVPLPEYLEWVLIVGVIWLTFWGTIITRFLEWIAKRWFDSKIDWNWVPNGNRHAYSKGFVHLENDGVNLGRNSCLLTIVYWILAALIFVVGFVAVAPKLAGWLSTYF